MERIYLAGPMTGVDDFNYPMFHLHESLWETRGWAVFNPARHFAGRQDLPREMYLRKATKTLLKVDAIAMLPDWEKSPGALYELSVAQNIGLEVFDSNTGRILDVS